MPRPNDLLDPEDDFEWSPGVGLLPRSIARTSFSLPRPASQAESDPYDPFEESSITPSPAMPKRSALDELASYQSEMPEVPKIKPWQRVLAGAVGGVAGALNARGRVHVDPEPAIQGIYAGDYPRQLENWKLKQAGLATRAKIEEQQMEEGRRKEESGARIAAYRAREASANRIPTPPPVAPPPNEQAYWTRKLDDPDPAVREQARARLRELNAKTPPRPTATVRPPSNTQQRLAAVDDAVDAGTLTPEEGATRKKAIIEETRAVAPPRREPQAPRPTSAQFKTVEDSKNDRLIQAETRAKRQIEDGEPEEQVYGDLETEKQRIQQMYEGEVGSLGGSPQHFRYPPKPAPTPKPVAAKPLTDPQKAADYLKRAGGDKEKARAMARAEGWTF